MQSIWIVVLVIAASGGLWLGFAEGIKIGVLVAVLALAAVTLAVFRGGFGSLGELPDRAPLEPTPPRAKRSLSAGDMTSAKLVTMILGGLLLGAAGFWVGFVEDFKIGLLIGTLAAAGATLAAFRGKVAF